MSKRRYRSSSPANDAEDNLTKLIMRHEGLRVKPYLCPSGKLTIGYGRNLESTGITKNEAAFLLENDIHSLDQKLSNEYIWYSCLSEARSAVILSMCFNLGLTGFSGFKKLIEAMAQRDYDRAAMEMLSSAWSGQVGRRAVELAQMMREDRFVAP